MVNKGARSRQEQIEELQLRLIELEREIHNPHPEDPFTFMSSGRLRLEYERDTLKQQLAFLLGEQDKGKGASASLSKKPRQTQQETIYKQIEAMRKRRPKTPKTKLFEELADKMGRDNPDSVRKAYYDQAAKLKKERDTKAREKRDAESKSAKENPASK
jgi:hypothetical protein